MSCYSPNPIIQSVQYPQPCDCCQDPECAQAINAKCVYYNGPTLPCIGISTGDNLEESLQMLEEAICEATGDYSTYNTYCLAPISTQQQFVEDISEGYCTLLNNFNTFVNVTFVNYQTSVTNQFNAILNPNITCAIAGVTNTDTIYQVFNKYCTRMTNTWNYVNLASVDWTSGGCFAVPTPPTNTAEAFDLILTQLCDCCNSGVVLPVFNNLGSCLPSPGASDSLVDTIDKIKTRLCQTPTFDINALTWGCLVKPSSTTTNLQAAFQTVLTTLNDYTQNKLTFSPDFVVSATDPMDPCAGLTVELAVPIVANDRLVAATPLDAAPGTLADKVTAGTNITLDFLTTPGQMIINAPLVADTYKVKADSTDTNPDFLIDKVEGVWNTSDGIMITDTYDPITENVLLTPSIDWTTFINKFFDVVEGDALLFARFCELACQCDCTSTTTTSTTLVPPCYDCFNYVYGPGVASCTINWTNCDGTLGSAYVNMGDTYNVTCMRESTGTGCGPWTKGAVCGSWGPGCTTTTTTTSAIAYLDCNFTVSNELASTDSASVDTNGDFILTTVAPNSSGSFIGILAKTVGNSLQIIVQPATLGTTVTLISLAGFSAPGCTVVATGSGTNTLTITVTPSAYNGTTYLITGDIEVGVS